MAQYGVDVVNPFDALEEGDGAPKVVPKAEQIKEKKAAKSAAAPTKAVEQSRTLDAPTKRGGAARFPRGRGGRGNGNRAPRRVFDRRSGTGRGREVRKGGYGGYDAEGTMQDDLKSVEVTSELNTEDAKPAEPAAAVETQPAKEETDEEKKAVVEEKEDKTMTYDQYMEQQKKKAVEDDTKLQVRQVQVDEKKFKACKKLEKVDDNDYDDVMGGTEKEADDTQKKSNEKKKKKVKHLDEVLAELPGGDAAGHGNRDLRGAGRGRGRGRGGFGPRGGFGRAGAPSTAVPAIADEAAFPKLGK